MIRLHLIEICWASDQYTQSSRKSAVYSRSRSALGLVYLRSLGGCVVIFRYYSLGGDAVRVIRQALLRISSFQCL